MIYAREENWKSLFSFIIYVRKNGRYHTLQAFLIFLYKIEERKLLIKFDQNWLLCERSEDKLFQTVLSTFNQIQEAVVDKDQDVLWPFIYDQFLEVFFDEYQMADSPTDR